MDVCDEDSSLITSFDDNNDAAAQQQATNTSETLKHAVMSSNMLSNSNEVCRDFLRNVCSRGNGCRFQHPELSAAACVVETAENDSTLVLCHDYLNANCKRKNCRYIHCSKSEEEFYKRSGALPDRVKYATENGLKLYSDAEAINGKVPLCRDHKRGECRRGEKCKYSHSSDDDETASDDSDLCSKKARLSENYDPFLTPRQQVSKRAKMTSFEVNLIEEENAILHRRIEDLKKQVSDLAATNEVLLEQNARLRASKTLQVATNGFVPTPGVFSQAQGLGIGLSNPAALGVITGLPAPTVCINALQSMPSMTPGVGAQPNAAFTTAYPLKTVVSQPPR